MACRWGATGGRLRPGRVILPHLLGILKEGAVDVQVCFGEAVIYDDNSNRKQVTKDVERQVRDMLQTQLYGSGLNNEP